MNYDLCLEVVGKLETIKQNKLQKSPLVDTLAKLMWRYGIVDLQYLNELAAGLLASLSKDEEGDAANIVLTPEGLLTADYLAELYRYTVKLIRKDVFGSEDPPFKSYEEAVNWIEKKGVSLDELSNVKKGIDIGKPYKFFFRSNDPITMVYYNKDGIRTNAFAPPKSKLSRVVKIAQQLSEKTDFEWTSFVMYILADIKPLLPPYEVLALQEAKAVYSEDGTIRYTKSSVTVKLNTELCFDELLSLYNWIRESCGVKRSKILNSKHLQLYQMVQRRGGPRKGKGAVSFWKSVMEEWNESYPGSYGHWKGVKIAYDRTIHKLSDRFRVEIEKEEKEG